MTEFLDPYVQEVRDKILEILETCGPTMTAELLRTIGRERARELGAALVDLDRRIIRYQLPHGWMLLDRERVSA